MSDPSDPRWVRALDLAVEVLLAAFAVFAVVHLLGAESGWGARTTGVLWLFLAAPATAALAWWGWRSPATGPPPPGSAEVRPGSPSPGTRAARVVVFVAPAVVAAVGLTRAETFTASWVLAVLLALGSVVVWSRQARPPNAARPPDGAPPAAHLPHLVALALAVGVAVLMLFVLNPSRDDVYYLNRAVWVAEHGTFPSRDTMFGPLTYPATYGAGLPVAALEEAYGSLARLLGVPAAGLAYLAANPLLAGLSVWTTWRLVRTWASRRALPALLVAVAVPLLAGTGLLGEFGYAREWQGKVVVILLVMPLAWVHLTRLARGSGPAAWSVTMLGVLGVAWCGLTITAPIFAGLLAGVGLLAALLLPGRRRPLGLGALALLAAPLLTGVATVLSSSGPVAEENYVSEPALVWAKVLGDDRAVVALLGLALLVGPLLARTREARLLAALAAVVTLAVMLPGVFALLDALTGSGPVAVRMLFTAPWPVLAGLLVTVPGPAALAARVPARGSAPAAVAPVLLPTVVLGLVLGLLGATGTPVWSPEAGASLSSSPTWKVKADDRHAVAAVLAEDPGPGPVLLPPGESRALAVTTTRTFAVVPRDFYVQFVDEPQDEREARFAFRRFMDPTRKDPTRRMLAQSLETLDVTLACVPGRARKQQRTLRAVGLTGRRDVAGLVCFDGPGTGSLTPRAGRAPAR